MKRKLKFLAILCLFAVTGGLPSYSQKTMDVPKFTRLENDLMARVTKPVKDKDEGKLCALIKVVTNLDDLEVRADALGIVEQEKHNGELWLYVPYAARSISFSKEGYYPLLYRYPENIDSGTVYELRLSGMDNSNGNIAQSATTQLFVLSHKPDDAKVFIDDMEQPTENGVFAAMMNKGDHSFRVEADRYETAEGSFTLEDEPVREAVKLQPLFGTFQIFTLPENDFDIEVNGEKKGVSPYKSERLDPGSYNIHISKKDFYPVDTLVRLRAGDELDMTCKLTSFADSLFYNRELGGRKVTFGVNVGYVMPFVSSKGSGGFTGSMVNYGCGDSRENVKYDAKSGFTAGISVDFKLVKNFYLVSGINYKQIEYQNKFSQTLEDFTVQNVNDLVYIGNMDNNFKEKYTLRMIELPVLASYRFVLTKWSSFHLNLGPYFTYGLSAKARLNGSSDTEGKVYGHMFGEIDYDNPKGTFTETSHTSGDWNLYSNTFSFAVVRESGMNLGHESISEYKFDSSPLKRFNYGLRLGAVYELRGFQLGLEYNLQISNMANKKFWESARIPVFNNKVGLNNMTGYKHHVHSLEVKLAYMFRY